MPESPNWVPAKWQDLVANDADGNPTGDTIRLTWESGTVIIGRLTVPSQGSGHHQVIRMQTTFGGDTYVFPHGSTLEVLIPEFSDPEPYVHESDRTQRSATKKKHYRLLPRTREQYENPEPLTKKERRVAREKKIFEEGARLMRDMAAVVVVGYGAEAGQLKEIKEKIRALPLDPRDEEDEEHPHFEDYIMEILRDL